MTSYYRSTEESNKLAQQKGQVYRSNQNGDHLKKQEFSCTMDNTMVVINDVQKFISDDGLEDFDSISMSSSYSGEWEKLFLRPNYYKNLQRYGILGRLRSSRFRSVCWRLYLGVLPHDQNKWLAEMRRWRTHYVDLRQKFIINPRVSMEACCDLSKNNPLSQETESPWNQYFQDNEIRITIQQDVVRTFPEVEFFRDKRLHARMVDILFCVARYKMHLSYKQGMHELLAPMIFVLHCDHQAFLHACEISSVSEVLKEILDPDYLEHDAFAMFCCVMDRLTEWYVSRDVSPMLRTPDPFTAQPFSREQDYNPSNVITSKLSRIQNEILQKFDPQLKNFLESMDIPPQIYGIRWLRLLFGREFPMQDLLVLWDAIFADGLDRDLVDFLFVTLLIYLREAILSSDYSSCLLLLMKFPAVGDVHYFIDKALYLREPNQYTRPPDYFFQPNKMQADGSPRIVYKTHDVTSTVHSNSSGTFMSNISTLTKKFNTRQGGKSSITKSSTDSVNSVFTDNATPTHERKQSAGSLSLNSDNTFSLPGQRRVHSQQNISQTETVSAVRSSASAVTHSGNTSARSSIASSPSFDDVPVEEHLLALNEKVKGGIRAVTKSKDSGDASTVLKEAKRPTKPEHRIEELEFEVAKLTGRLNDMEFMCEQCADYMDKHVGKLQTEMLRQHLDKEDEILLSIAGLKQVRDILKGTLKPNELFDIGDNGQIVICEDHFNDMPLEDSKQTMLPSDGYVHIITTNGGQKISQDHNQLFYDGSNPLNGQANSASLQRPPEMELRSLNK